MNTNNPHGFDPMQPPIPRPSGNHMGWIIGCVAAVIAIPLFVACAGVLVALLLPAVSASREAARRMQCSNNMKQIGLALHNYESVYKSFPPAYTVDAAGQPLHSWRTLLLPYLEQEALYQQIDFSKPWDDPANASLSEIVIPTYQCPSTELQPGMTTYVAVVDPSGIFSGPDGCRFDQITDGLSNTLLVAETDSGHAVPWMAPQDIDLKVFRNAGVLPTSHVGGANVTIADGSIQFLGSESDSQTRKSLISKAAAD